jgi:hypothetical protein
LLPVLSRHEVRKYFPFRFPSAVAIPVVLAGASAWDRLRIRHPPFLGFRLMFCIKIPYLLSSSTDKCQGCLLLKTKSFFLFGYSY